MSGEFSQHIISISANARQALQQLNDLTEFESRTLFVVDENGKLEGSITDGDIRRGLLAGMEISDKVSRYMNTGSKYFTEDTMKPEKIKQYRNADILLVPFLDERNCIKKIINLKTLMTIIPASALLMAGGRGERLRPLTDLVPKPMLLINEKPILEHNIDRLIKFGISEFFISVKYLSEQIMDYFGDGSAKGVSITYIQEDAPMGTIAAMKKVNKFRYEDVLLMNSDIICNIDFEDFYQFYKSRNVKMSVASIPYHIQVPYGVLELETDNLITSLTEKPTYTYYSNAGIYFLNASLKDLIPENSFFNATDLMEKLISQNEKIVHFPILNYWMDIGRPQDYYKVQEEIKHIKF
jgi:dTDP-glucose pyrophosphorylase